MNGPNRLKDITYTKGFDERRHGGTMVTYGIHEMVDGKDNHRNRIEVHGNEALRDWILEMLEGAPETVKDPEL